MNVSPLIKTVGGATLGKCNVENQRLFSINAGVSGEEALQHASALWMLHLPLAREKACVL